MPPSHLIPLHRTAVGGHPLHDLFQQAGVTPWVDQEIAPALILRVRRGQNVTVSKGGTPDKPTWTITPAAASSSPPRPLFGTGAKPLFGGKPMTPLKSKSTLIPLKPTGKPKSGFVPLLTAASQVAQPLMQARQSRFQRIDADPWGTGTAVEAGGLLGGGPGDTAIGLSAGGVEGAGRQIERGQPFELIDSDGFRKRL